MAQQSYYLFHSVHVLLYQFIKIIEAMYIISLKKTIKQNKSTSTISLKDYDTASDSIT